MDINTSYNSAMSKAIPGSFVPDIAPGGDSNNDSVAGGAGVAGGASFKDTVKSFLGDVNDKVAQSDQLTKDLAAGRTSDVGKVVTSVEEANLAMEFTLAVRNKLLDAYTEISRMQM